MCARRVARIRHSRCADQRYAKATLGQGHIRADWLSASRLGWSLACHPCPVRASQVVDGRLPGWHGRWAARLAASVAAVAAALVASAARNLFSEWAWWEMGPQARTLIDACVGPRAAARSAAVSGGVRTFHSHHGFCAALVLGIMRVMQARSSDALILPISSPYVATSMRFDTVRRRMSAPHAPAFACLCGYCIRKVHKT